MCSSDLPQDTDVVIDNDLSTVSAFTGAIEGEEAGSLLHFSHFFGIFLPHTLIRNNLQIRKTPVPRQPSLQFLPALLPVKSRCLHEVDDPSPRARAARRSSRPRQHAHRDADQLAPAVDRSSAVLRDWTLVPSPL